VLAIKKAVGIQRLQFGERKFAAWKNTAHWLKLGNKCIPQNVNIHFE
jgi:hypothetical protein